MSTSEILLLMVVHISCWHGLHGSVMSIGHLNDLPLSINKCVMNAEIFYFIFNTLDAISNPSPLLKKKIKKLKDFNRY